MKTLATLLLCLCSIAAQAQKITDLSALTGPATGDLLYIVDISDTSGSASGTGKKITLANLSTILSPTWANIATKPTTMSGFGLTDAQPLDADLTAIAALTTTSFGRSLLDDANAAAGRTTLGIYTDRRSVTSSLTGLTGGSGKLDGLLAADYTEGDELTFKIGDVWYHYRLSDDGALPAEASPTYILPDIASGTKFWMLVSYGEDDSTSGTATMNLGTRQLLVGELFSTGAIETDASVVVGTSLTVSGASTFSAVVTAPTTRSGAGAVSILVSACQFTSTGAAQALTLADGENGQIIAVAHTVDGGSGVLTPATRNGYASITLDDAGDSVTLMFFTTTGWTILSNYGCTVTP